MKKMPKKKKKGISTGLWLKEEAGAPPASLNHHDSHHRQAFGWAYQYSDGWAGLELGKG